MRVRPSRPLNYGYSQVITAWRRRAIIEDPYIVCTDPCHNAVPVQPSTSNDDDRSNWIQADWLASSDDAKAHVKCPWQPHNSNYPFVLFDCANMNTGLQVTSAPYASLVG